MLLDASRAFDRVHYLKLFRILSEKGVCPVVIRVLMRMYIRQKFCIRWGSCTSAFQSASNGVKQGGVLSPVLFVNYIDELLKRLQGTGVGCYVGNVFIGALGYADDVTLLSPTRAALRFMLQVCDDFAQEFDVTFNPDKSKYLVFGQPDREHAQQLRWKNRLLKETHCDKHLGNIIGQRSERESMEAAIGDFYRRFNLMMHRFQFCSPTVLYALFKPLCMSLYGSQLWDYSNESCIRPFFVAWRKSLRRLLGLPQMTHGYLLPILVDDVPVEMQLHKRTLKFFKKCLHAGSICTRTSAQLVLRGSRSRMGRSLTFVCYQYKIVKHLLEDQSENQIVEKLVYSPTDELIARAGAIKDFLAFKRNMNVPDRINRGRVIRSDAQSVRVTRSENFSHSVRLRYSY
jgi:hypothetical protein